MYILLQDLRFACRQMRRSPGFAVTAVLILALGIAANVIVFGVLQAIILQPIDAANPEQVKAIAPSTGGYPVASYPEVRDLRDRGTMFSGVAAEAVNLFGLEVAGATRPAWGDEVSGQYFEVMGTRPALGRLLRRSDDDHPGASQAVVLSWPEWQSSFGGDPDVVGKTVRINKYTYTIVGVTEKGFYGTMKIIQPDLFLPMANQASLEGTNWLEDRRDKHIFPIVRIKDGVAPSQAQAELNTIAARIAKENPKEEDGLQFHLATPGLAGDFLGGPARRFLAGVMALAGVLLLAACANLGSLFASRTADRTREIAIRLAVGSSRWRVVRQILIEAFVISLLGGAVACALSWMALGGLARWRPPTDYPMRFLVQPQPSLILVAFLISALAGTVFGLVPLRQIFRTDPNDAIKSGSSQAGGGRRWALRDVLLAAQIALCCVTVTAAFVALRGLGRSLTMQMGFDPKNAVLTSLDVSQAGYTGEAAEHLQRELLQRVSQLPGVSAAAYADRTPLGETETTPIFAAEAADMRPSKAAFQTYFYNISPGYFDAASTSLLEGRDIRWTDTAKSPLVAVVNRQFARTLFHTDHAVGRHFKSRAGLPIEIVGMVADGKYFQVSEGPEEAAFFSILQRPGNGISLIARTRPEPSGVAVNDLTASIRKTIHDLDPALPIRISGEWKSTLGLQFFPAQVATVSLGLFGAFGLLLSITGTFGLASYTVSKRLRELCIRVALGAQGQEVLSAALGRMLVLLASGSVVGLLLGLATSKVLSAIVYQASAQDPLVLLSAATTILLTGLLSVSGPVWRALHVDPARVLREE